LLTASKVTDFGLDTRFQDCPASAIYSRRRRSVSPNHRYPGRVISTNFQPNHPDNHSKK